MRPRDMWILPSGELLDIEGSHGHTAARWFKLREVTAHEGLCYAEGAGWIRVVGYSGEFDLDLTAPPSEAQWDVVADIVATKNKNRMRLIVELAKRRDGILIERPVTIDADRFEIVQIERLRAFVASVYGRRTGDNGHAAG